MHSPLSCFGFASSSLRDDRVSHLESYAVCNLNHRQNTHFYVSWSRTSVRGCQRTLLYTRPPQRESSTTKAKARETANNLSPAPTSLPLLAEDEARLWQALAKERRESRLTPGGLVFSASVSMAWSRGKALSDSPFSVLFSGLRKILRKTSCYMRELVGGGHAFGRFSPRA